MSIAADLANRPERAWNEDGIPEIVSGSSFLILGAISLVEPRVPIVLILLMLLPPQWWLLRRWKRTVTAPRAGYAEPAWFTQQSVAVSGIVFVAVATLSVLADDAIMAASISLLAAGVLAFSAVRTSTIRHGVVALIPLAFAVWVVRSAAGLGSVRWLFLWLGLGIAIGGAITYLRFIRVHPLEANES